MIRKFFEKLTGEQYVPEPQDSAIAAAVLMTEIIRADHDVDDTEKDAMRAALKSLIPERDVEALLTEAFDTVDVSMIYSVSHLRFTISGKSSKRWSFWSRYGESPTPTTTWINTRNI